MTWKNKEFRIELACGCGILSRTSPISPRVKFVCRSNMGHGYSQPWVSYRDVDGSLRANRSTRK